MKKIKSLLVAGLFVATQFACGGGSTQETTDETSKDTTEAVDNTANMMEYDLSPHGMNATIMIPDGSVGKPMVQENPMGGVDIVVGKNFGISVLFGMGDKEMVKADLNDDLVYETTIHSEEDNLLVFEKNIPDGGMEPEQHFYYTITIDGEIYDVQNMTAQTYNKGAVEIMVASAKSLKAKTAS